jgi:hypothetical protein
MELRFEIVEEPPDKSPETKEKKSDLREDILRTYVCYHSCQQLLSKQEETEKKKRENLSS